MTNSEASFGEVMEQIKPLVNDIVTAHRKWVMSKVGAVPGPYNEMGLIALLAMVNAVAGQFREMGASSEALQALADVATKVAEFIPSGLVPQTGATQPGAQA